MKTLFAIAALVLIVTATGRARRKILTLGAILASNALVGAVVALHAYLLAWLFRSPNPGAIASDLAAMAMNLAILVAPAICIARSEHRPSGIPRSALARKLW